MTWNAYQVAVIVMLVIITICQVIMTSKVT